jgi:hypothetical protein
VRKIRFKISCRQRGLTDKEIGIMQNYYGILIMRITDSEKK